MSQENVDLVRRNYEAFAQGGFDRWMEHWSDDLDYRPERDGVDNPGPIRGKNAMRKYIRDWIDTFDEYRFEPVELIDAGQDTVVAVERFGGRAKLSGVETDQTCGVVFTIREGKIARCREYATRAEALEAAGLSAWENAEQRALAEDAIGALNSGDLDAFLALIAEDVEFTSMVAEAEGTTFRGHDGVRAWWQTVRGAFEDVQWELFDVRGSGDRGVLHFRMTGTLGGVPVEQNMWQATQLRDGKVIWWAFFRSEREAFQAVGLSA